jgi:CheY-like chemotaxis protein
MGSKERRLHILVVDCDEDAAEVTTAMLEHLGYTAQTETESLKALKTFSTKPDKFDLAIVEPIMPELMGIELAVRFRRIRRGFPVMLYSGYIDPPLSEEIETAGLGEAVTKPLDLQELRGAVDAAARRSLVDVR